MKQEVVKSEVPKQSYEAQKKLKSLNNKLNKVERAISDLEKKIKDIDMELAVNYEETIAQPDFFDMYQGKKKQLETLMEDWETLQEEMDALESQS